MAACRVTRVGRRSWDWDVGYLYNQNKGVQVGTGNLNLAAVRMAVGPSFLNSQGVVQCGTPDNPIPLGTSQGESHRECVAVRL